MTFLFCLSSPQSLIKVESKDGERLIRYKMFSCSVVERPRKYTE